MRRGFAATALVLAILFATGCGSNNSPTAPSATESDSLRQGGQEGNATTSAVTSAPTISGVNGTTSTAAGISGGLVAMSCGATYNGGRVVNDVADIYPWTISGSNFGSTRGSVRVGGVTATITSWSSNQIVAYPTTPRYDVGPSSTFLEVTTASGLTARKTASIVPAIRSRIYGQCTWWVALKRLRLGRQPSPTAYGGYSNFTASYVPAVGDQLQWAGRHTAIITQVTGPVISGTQRKWTATIEEYNASCTNAYNVYSDTYAVANGQIVDSLRSSVSSLGNASSYYR